MSTSTARGRRIPGTAVRRASDDRWSRVLRVLSLGMASVAVRMGAPPSGTLWAALITERYRVKRPDPESGVRP